MFDITVEFNHIPLLFSPSISFYVILILTFKFKASPALMRVCVCVGLCVYVCDQIDKNCKAKPEQPKQGETIG